MLHPKKRCQECGGTEFKIHEGGEICMSCGSCTYDGERPAEPPKPRLRVAPGSEPSRLNLLKLTTTVALSILDQKIASLFPDETTRTRNEIKRITELLIRNFYENASRDLQRLGLSDQAENIGLHPTVTRCGAVLNVKNTTIVENLLMAALCQIAERKKDERFWRTPLGYKLQHHSATRWVLFEQSNRLKQVEQETMILCLKKALENQKTN
jgi:hypothetical protein